MFNKFLLMFKLSVLSIRLKFYFTSISQQHNKEEKNIKIDSIIQIYNYIFNSYHNEHRYTSRHHPSAGTTQIQKTYNKIIK